MVQLSDKITLTCSTLSSEGEGIGVYNGLKIFVEGLLIGESGEVQIYERAPRYAKAKLLRRLSTSKDRISAKCPIYGLCGGCEIACMSYEKQLLAKKERVLESLRRIGHLNDFFIEDCIASPQEFHYRHKIQLPIIYEGSKQKIGLFKKKSHDVIEVENCLIHCTSGEEILKNIRQELIRFCSLRYLLIKNSANFDEALLLFVTRGGETEELKAFSHELLQKIPGLKGVVESINLSEANTVLGPTFTTLAGRNYIYERLLNCKFKVSASSFFQINPHQAENIFRKALDLSNLQKSEILLDAYSGVGVFALLASPYIQKAIGSEVVRQAVLDARENAALNNISNVIFHVGKAEELFSRFDVDVLFLNPPRKGCEESLLKTIAKKSISKIIYLSCDPATLARDLAILHREGFSLCSVHPFDLFPQTMHVETLAFLSRFSHLR